MPNEPNDIPGGQPAEPVEDRPNGGTVQPDQYPEKDRSPGITDPPLDDETGYEPEPRQLREDAQRAGQPA